MVPLSTVLVCAPLAAEYHPTQAGAFGGFDPPEHQWAWQVLVELNIFGGSWTSLPDSCIPTLFALMVHYPAVLRGPHPKRVSTVDSSTVVCLLESGAQQTFRLGSQHLVVSSL